MNAGESALPAMRAMQALTLVLVLTAANMLFNAVATALGWPFPYTTFLFLPEDRFGDFFKFVLSYPGGTSIVPSHLFGLHDRITADAGATGYLGIEGLGRMVSEHLHVTPLSTLLSLVCLKAMRWADPAAMFFLLGGALIAYWCRIAIAFGRNRRERLAWCMLGIVAYPTVMMLDRGNLFAGLAGFLIVHAMLLGIRRRAPILAAILLAIAVNIRPNAIVLALPLLAFHAGARMRLFVALGLAGCVVFGASMILSTTIYPDYTPTTFLAGLRTYYAYYVIGPAGLPYSSSLYGMLKFLFGFRAGIDKIATLASGALLLAGMIAWGRRRIDDEAFLFVACAVYVLGSTIFADYHLIAMLAPVMALAGTARPHRAIWLPCLLILAPKNYVFVGQASLQVLLNPLLLLAASLPILLSAARRRPTPA